MNNSQENKHKGQGHDKEFTIIVNGREKVVTAKQLSFAEVIALAFDSPPTGDNTIFTVTYRKGENDRPEGSLVAGDMVKVKEGMIFNVTATNKS